MEKERGSGIIFYTKKPKRVLLLLRDRQHQDIGKILPYPGMLDIPGGHAEPNETPQKCIVREIAEEWIDLRTGQPFQLKNFNFFRYFEHRNTAQWHFCKEMDFDLTDVDYNEGTALALINEEAAMRTEIAWGCTELLRDFFKSRFMQD